MDLIENWLMVLIELKSFRGSAIAVIFIGFSRRNNFVLDNSSDI